MWQRFTDAARKVLFYAHEEAGILGLNYVSSEHLLLGLTRDDGTVAARVLVAMGLPPARIRSEISRQAPHGSGRTGDDMPLTPGAKRIVDLAFDEARQFNTDYIGSEHLLLGCVREHEGLAAQVLAKLGVELASLRQKVVEFEANRPLGEPALAVPVSPTGRMNLMVTDMVKLAPAAYEEAKALGRDAIGIEHLVLAAVADSESIVARLLAQHAIDAQMLRETLKNIYENGGDTTAGGAESPK